MGLELRDKGVQKKDEALAKALDQIFRGNWGSGDNNSKAKTLETHQHSKVWRKKKEPQKILKSDVEKTRALLWMLRVECVQEGGKMNCV